MRPVILAGLATLLAPTAAQAFCGHYVGQPGNELYSGVSEVVLTRQGTTTTLTLANDYQGDLTEFAVLIPVPPGVTEDDVTLAPADLLGRVREYSAPRYVEYSCNDLYPKGGGGCRGLGCRAESNLQLRDSSAGGAFEGAPSLDVTVEQEFAVGSYEIVVLSSTDAGDLMTWLNNEGYGVSDEAEEVLTDYVEAGSQFFAAKVSLDDPIVGGGTFLEPLQVSYESEVMSLPIRLGTLNSPGVQDLILYVINVAGEDGSNGGPVGIANYPEVEVETNCLVEEEPANFAEFYAGQLDDAFGDEPAAWASEYAWNPSGCDPCPPGGSMTPEDMVSLGVAEEQIWGATLTRLHMRYTADAAAEDLVLYSTGEFAQWQMRYIQHKDRLEGTFAVCGEGFVEDPRTCPRQEDVVQRSSAGGWLSFGFVGMLAGLGLLLRRRRR